MPRFYLVYLFLIVLAVNCNAQFFEVKKYDMTDGMKSDYLSHVYYDKKGYIWITDGSFGVTRFDGKTFKNFNDQETDIVVKANFGEVGNRIRFISNGFIYDIESDSIVKKVEIDNIACKKNNGDRSTISLRNALLDAKGIMWTSPDLSRIYAFDGVKTVEIKNANRKGSLGLNNQNECFYLEETNDHLVLHILKLNPQNHIINKIHKLSKDEYYLGSSADKIYTWKKGTDNWILTEYAGLTSKQTLIKKDDYQSMNDSRFIVFKNNAYLCTYNSIIEFKNSNYRVYGYDANKLIDAPPIIYDNKLLYGNILFDGNQVKDIFPTTFLPKGDLNIVTSVTSDNERNIWYATRSGLFKASLTPIRKIPYNKSSYLGNDTRDNHFILFGNVRKNFYKFDSLIIVDKDFKNVKSIKFNSEPIDFNVNEENGNIHFISADLNTYSILDKNFKEKKIKIDKTSLKNYSSNQTENYFSNWSSVFSSKLGGFYFYNEKKLVFVKAGIRTVVPLPANYNNSEFIQLILTKNQELLLHFKDVIVKYENGIFSTIPVQNIKPNFEKFNIICNNKDSTGPILIPKDTLQAIYIYQNNSFKEYIKSDNSIFSLSQNAVSAIRNYFWVKNALFITCEGFGILRLNFEANRFTLEPIGKLNGLPSTKLSAFIVDRDKNLWFFNNISRNIIHYTLKDFINRKYTNFKQFIGSPVSGFPRPKLDKNGLIYVAVDEGIVSIDQKHLIQNILPNKPFIEKLLLVNEKEAIEKNITNFIEIPYKSNVLVKYNLIKFNENDKLRFSCKLEGLHINWQPETENRSITFNSLPAGNYKLYIRVLINEKWIECGTPVSFTVLKPFWQKWWFICFVFLLVILLLWLYLKLREKKLIEKQKQLERKIDTATFEIKSQKVLIEEKHKEITDSINYAERIQRSFMTTEKSLDKYLDDYFILFKPKDVVSGDFYWSSLLNNGKFAFVTADSTGHGVPGAIMSILNITSLESTVKDDFVEPSDILNETRKIIIERLKNDGSEEGGKDGMDCSLIVFDFENKQIVVSAANNPVWIVRNEQIIEIKGDKMPVGKSDKDSVSFTKHVFNYEIGDIIYTITDGFADQFGGPKGKKYLGKRLKEVIISNSRFPLTEQKKLLEFEFNQWLASLDQVDDVTIVGIKL